MQNTMVDRRGAPAIKVDTDRISYVSFQLKNANTEMNNSFRAVKQKGKTMISNWHSPAAESASTIYYELIRGNQARSDVLNEYSKMLDQAIVPNANQVELSNKKLADVFK